MKGDENSQKSDEEPSSQSNLMTDADMIREAKKMPEHFECDAVTKREYQCDEGFALIFQAKNNFFNEIAVTLTEADNIMIVRDDGFAMLAIDFILPTKGDKKSVIMRR